MALHSIFAAAFGATGVPLSDPPGSSVLTAAVDWVQAALLGTMATTLAILAVAAVGFMMLGGRISVRPALTVVLGCFVLFGAAQIVAGIRASLGARDTSALSSVPEDQAPVPVAPAANAQQRDPYAGAAVPTE